MEWALPDVKLIKPQVFHDRRGYFLETFQAQRYEEAGVPSHFVQDNHSHSTRSILRGLHYQYEQPQGKLVRVSQGRILDVAVDIRQDSPTFGQWVSAVLDDEHHHQMYIPPGFAHGFCVFSDTADVIYKCTTYYDPQSEMGVRWDDSDINISWPVPDPELSDKDKQWPNLKEIEKHYLPKVTLS